MMQEKARQPFAYSVLTTQEKVESIGYDFEEYQDAKAKAAYNPFAQVSDMMFMGGTSGSWCTRSTSTGVVFTDSDQQKDDQ